jgi:hypothetical protein
MTSVHGPSTDVLPEPPGLDPDRILRSIPANASADHCTETQKAVLKIIRASQRNVQPSRATTFEAEDDEDHGAGESDGNDGNEQGDNDGNEQGDNDGNEENDGNEQGDNEQGDNDGNEEGGDNGDNDDNDDLSEAESEPRESEPPVVSQPRALRTQQDILLALGRHGFSI